MDDLISRKVVMNYLSEQQAMVITAENKGVVDEEVRKGMNSAINTFINFIVQCPTAYDTDKVSKQAEEVYKYCSNHICKECKYKKYDQCRDGVILELIKAGGVNE